MKPEPTFVDVLARTAVLGGLYLFLWRRRMSASDRRFFDVLGTVFFLALAGYYAPVLRDIEAIRMLSAFAGTIAFLIIVGKGIASLIGAFSKRDETLGFICPVCGFPQLRRPPYGSDGKASFEACPSCAYQFGISDDVSYTDWRETWVAAAMPWRNYMAPCPGRWNPKEQLKSIGVDVDAKTTSDSSQTQP